MDPLAAIDARRSPGVGVVPRPPPADAARKWLRELPARGILDTRSVGARISFTRVGLRVDELRAFFDAAKRAAKKSEKICESGNTYGVNRAFAAVNAAVMRAEAAADAAVLAPDDAARFRAFVDVVVLDAELRNRNPLHPSVLDAAVIGNLLDFPKAAFGFPFACYATDGREALSLCLYSYRQRTGSTRVAVRGDAAEVAAVAARIGMTATDDVIGAACVVCALERADLEEIAAAAARAATSRRAARTEITLQFHAASP
mmetsp:Transcript_28360/g.87741  ORF Transcript_28360/g.87741 Transcript_28360/m.87741 type:complete len:259 (+) Transcript_28360:213-989(+)